MEESIHSSRSFEAKLPQDVREMVKVVIRTAEFRSIETMLEKVNILRNSEFMIPVNYACIAVGTSTKTYYKHMKLIASGESEPEKNSTTSTSAY